MMKGIRVLALVLILLLTVTLTAGAAPKAKSAKPLKVKVYAQGEAFCPTAVLVFGSIIIQAGRCYTLFILRESPGTFLAFADPGAKIPPGQLVRLTTPAGAKVKGRIFYLVPIQTTAVLVPLNTITLAAVRVEDFGPRLTIVLTSTAVPNVTVTFTVRL